jgi:hypothetical protein
VRIRAGRERQLFFRDFEAAFSRLLAVGAPAAAQPDANHPAPKNGLVFKKPQLSPKDEASLQVLRATRNMQRAYANAQLSPTVPTRRRCMCRTVGICFFAVA